MRLFVLCFSMLALVIRLGSPAQAGPLINEFLASNNSIHPDNSDFEDYSDWIELHNPTSTNVSLANHFLTDDLSQPFKWLFPTNAVIPANGYLMVHADGHDAAPGQAHLRGYWPWGSTFTTRRYHASFRLSADGEDIGLYRTAQAPQDITLIPANAIWKYLDAGTNPGGAWMTLNFDDSAWPQGPAELGYGDGDEATVVSYGPSAGNKYPTTHFRHHFNVTDPARLGNIRLRVNVDDGAILYLNGAEFARLRMPAGAVTHTTYASAGPSPENGFEFVELPRSLFRVGENVFAAEVHQVAANSSDLSWAAELIVSEVNGPAILVDSVTFGSQQPDISYGRNATNGWSFFAMPTPDGANTTEPLQQFTPASAVTASLDSGFYQSPQMVSLSSTPDAVIRYTLSGATPDLQSPLYDSPLTISTNTILRARAFAPGLIPGPVLTRSYFINEPTDRTLPVISFVADPATLFDNVIGIYSNDTAYPYKGREIPARVEFFEPDGQLGFAVSAGMRIGGENIWRFAQRPLNLHLRGKYGDDFIPHQIFPDEPVGTFGKLNLRNGGDNWALDMLRDAMMAPILRGQVENDLSSYRPAVVYVNGRYWGIHDIRKQFDPLFFANEHQLAEDTYDLVQYAHNESGVTVLMADTGNIDTYETFHAFYTTHDLSQPTNYATMEAWMNVDSFIDYVVANDFGVNTSWSHNREFWCARAPGSRWQWNVPDFDRCFDSPNLQSSLIDDFRASYPLFRALDDNPNFVNRLLQRYAAHLGSTLYSNRFNAILDSLASEVEGEIPRHIARWAAVGGMPSLAARQAQLDEIRQFTVGRPAYAVSRLQTELGLNRGMADLAVTCTPTAGGNVRIAGVPLTPEWNTTIGLFLNTPVEITAEPAPGYTFLNWSTGETNPTITLVLTDNESLTANFQPGVETVLPSNLTSDTTLTAANSPYTLTNDLIVPENVTLTLGPGVKFLLPPARNLEVHGTLLINGTSNAPVELRARTARPWGNLSFVNATGHSVLTHLIVRDATVSRRDPVNLKAAISAYNSILTLDHVDIDANLPVFTRFGATTLRDSRIHIRFTGDGINIKFGAGIVDNCTFTGAVTPDTDAIDFDGVTDGLIRGNRIYAFRGFNSDAIDVGEGCQNLLVVSNRIYHMFDKGVSVGQGSTAYVERNLIVSCDMGIGVKDTGSTAFVNQNTFARNNVDVAAYEKNFGNGGGIAHITNSIFSRTKKSPVTVDALSSLSVRYSLSDTLPLVGPGNLLADPLFTDAGLYDFSLTANSPARDTGDPTHALDLDGTRTDMGAYYTYRTNDYPYLVPNLVVVNEVMAHSHDAAPDWIELFNNSSQDLDIGGWYLSDSANTLLKYRIADGTILPGNGYLVFYEDQHFGATSTDPGALIPFALSENGELVHIFGPGDGVRPDYTEQEGFGASATGVSLGRYYKASTRTYNFIAMATPTPGVTNSAPLVGPIVISEIMYHPPVADAEYLELANITANEVTLFDPTTGTPWKFTQGITHEFPATPPLTFAPGERIVLVRNSAVFAQNYAVADGTRVFEWDSGILDNGGETLDLSMPGDINNAGVRQYIRVDRVDYSDTAPWPVGPDGGGTALTRINEHAYGNDVANWTESTASPGQTSYQQWANAQSFPPGQSDPDDDPDGDGIPNAMEYALGSNPLLSSSLAWNLSTHDDTALVSFSLNVTRPDVGYSVQKAASASLSGWINLPVTISPGAGQSYTVSAQDSGLDATGFYRLVIVLFNQ
ncbi:MAG: lamin tail domain-containing protein [Verrucomicrobiae bacterium]|nr:lamin tail domain-containing protein [Verrucomicrobiae bacterium]